MHQPERSIAAATVLALAAAFWLRWVPDRPDAGWVVLLIWPWTLAAVWAALRGPGWSTGRILVLATLLRLPFVGTTPWLSDDLYRYLWEGLALGAGVDVFSVAPATVLGLDDALRDRVNHGALTSIYPPLALAWFRLLAWGPLVPATAQLATSAVDLLTVGLLCTLAPTLRAGLHPGLLWALHPLPILAAAHGAHLDVVAVACTVALLAALRAGAHRTALTGLCAGIGVKLFPIVLIPLVLRALRPRAPTTSWLVGPAVLVGLGLWALWPCLGAGGRLFESLGTYARDWSFNGAIEPWLRPVLEEYTRPLLLVAGAFAVLISLVRRPSVVLGWRDAGAAFLLLTPTAHPWYALWLLAPAALSGSLPWVGVASAVSSSYLVLITLDPLTGIWQEPAWLWWLTWLPALAALGWREPKPEPMVEIEISS
jgi:hypothetical protein